MGLSIYKNFDVRPAGRDSLYYGSSPTYLSPACPICHEPPKAKVLDSLMMRCNYRDESDAIKSLPQLLRTPYHPTSIKEVNIGIIGGTKSGKTQLRHCQLLNGVFFPSYDGSNTQFMINLVENPPLDSVDGAVIVYSITKERSLSEVVESFSSHPVVQKIPCILVGNKSDKAYRRQVDSQMAQNLARQLGCPFREVSARCNDSVSECFAELLRLIDARL
uniref:GTP-binding protein Rheb n=1 Tax=Steinernema glaseri TaxID=37863 RepID=A0A1I7ZIL5_9BILA